jgi:Fe-S-cluster containining protein
MDFEGFASTIARDLAKALDGAETAAELSAALGRTVAAAERELADRLDPAESAHIACRAGCGTCCRVNVAVLFPEAVAILEYAGGHFPPQEMARLKSRVDDLYRSVRWLDDEERLFLRRPCAFLDEGGNCSIHPVRPLLCRSVTSTDPERCRQAVALPALGETPAVLMNLFQKTLMEAAFRGIGEALAAAGMDARGMTLTAAVKLLLDRPEAVGNYLAGAPLPGA